MGSKGEACDECSRNCLMIHHKHDPPQIFSSFFKVMFGKNFSDLLILPPRFVKINSLVDRETYLEDSSGQKWNVVLSTINDSLAFQNGWREFVLDHGIDMGDFVVFHFITRSYFVVQIYGRSGCEKPSFSSASGHMNKRAKTSDPVVPTHRRDSFSNKIPSEEADTNPCVVSRPNGDVTERRNDPFSSLKNDIEMSEVTPRTSTCFPEDSCFMFSRDTSSAHEDDRAHLFDLSTFERLENIANRMQLQRNGCSENGANKNHITEANPVDCSKQIRHSLKEENSLPFTSYPSVNYNKPLSRDLPERPSRTLPESDTTAASGRGMIHIKKSSQEFCRNPVTGTSFNVSGNEAKPTTILPEVNINTGKLDDNFNHLAKDEDEGETIVKQEPADICDESPSLAIKVTCLVKPESELFLELPDKLPLKVPRQGLKGGKKLVFLRDQVNRQWPVVYHQKNGVFVLTSGWKSFRKTNNIQPGDECIFMVESVNESIFEVQILRR